MKKQNYLSAFAMLILTLSALMAGYWVGDSERQQLADSLIEQVRGEIKRMEYETMRNLKLLTALKEGKTELVEDQLTGLVVMGISEPDAVTQETINKARDYQSKYCDNKCLGL